MQESARQNQHNRSTFDRTWQEYLNRPLLRPEVELIRLYRDRWRETDMLDLGVGAGRTSLIFSILARSYLGIDYAPRMIEACRSIIRESDTVQLAVGDAAELSSITDRQFDVILFSFNGIDCVSHDRRLKVLSEVRKRLKSGGHFLFSSHSLNVFPFRLGLPKKGADSWVRYFYRCARRLQWYCMQKFLNRHIRIAESRQRGWEMIADGEHGMGTRFCYVLPEYQITQLKEAGFEIVAVLNDEGKSIDWHTPVEDNWLHYLCT